MFCIWGYHRGPQLSNNCVGRNCAGKQFAEPSLFIAIASVLHAFVVDPPLDERGSPRVLTYDDIKMVPSFVACVSPAVSALFGKETD